VKDAPCIVYVIINLVLSS